MSNFNDCNTTIQFKPVTVGQMNRMFDKELGKTNFMLTSREKVNLITILQDDDFLILYIDPSGDYVKIIEKIKNQNKN